VEGARSAIVAAARKDDQRSRWINRLVVKRGAGRVAVAVANRNARISWALLSKGEAYRGAGAGGGGRLRIIPLEPARENVTG
jgi:transposase